LNKKLILLFLVQLTN